MICRILLSAAALAVLLSLPGPGVADDISRPAETEYEIMDLPEGNISYQGEEKRFTVTTPNGEFDIEGGDFRLESEPGGHVMVLPITKEVTVFHDGRGVTAVPNDIVRIQPGRFDRKLFVTVINE